MYVSKYNFNDFSVVTPEIQRRERKPKVPTTVISSSHSLESLDMSLPGLLTPPQDWIDSVKQNHRSSWDMTVTDKNLDMDWLSHCLECLLTEELVEKYGLTTTPQATKIITRDLIFLQKIKEVRTDTSTF